MAFSFYAPPRLTPEQANPANAFLTRALDTYNKGLDLSYKPQQIQADIFNKNVAPIANMMVSDAARFMAPEQRKQMLDYVSQHLSKLTGQPYSQGESGQQGQGLGDNGIALPPSEATTSSSKEAIAGQKILNDRFETLKAVIANISKESGIKGMFHRATLGAAGSPYPVVDLLANKQVTNAQNNLEEALIKYKHLSPQKAHQIASKALTETISDYQTNLNEQQKIQNSETEEGKKTLNKGVNIGNIDKKIEIDEKERAEDEEAAQYFNTSPEMIQHFKSTGQELTAENFRKFMKNLESNGVSNG